MSYRNPVIPGFYPDPSICRVGSDYFLVASSFTYFPGVPIFRSTDLIHWEQIGNVLDRPSHLDLTKTGSWSSLGVYAPTIRHHEGRFWVITTNTTDEGWNTFFVSADDPAGPWSDPITVLIPGIDPDLAWDEQGRCWVHYSGVGAIGRCQIDPLSGQILSGPETTWSGSGLQYPEAPHAFEHDGMWYLVIAEGGTEAGHAVSIARGPSVEGPWDGAPANPILSHRSTDKAIQNTGHADFVQGADGSWWMVVLGVRRRGITPGFHVLGRETFLTPVQWSDGWPVPAPLELEMPHDPPRRGEDKRAAIRTEFDQSALGPEWVSVRRPPSEFSSTSERDGWLVMQAGDETLDMPRPSFLGRRQRHLQCEVRARVDTGSAVEAGLAAYMDESAHYEVAVRGPEVLVRARIGPLSQIVARAPRPSGYPVLSITVNRDTRGPDKVALGYQDGIGNETVLAELDGRFLSTEVVGGFLGRTIGMYAVDGSASWNWFEYTGSDV